MPQVLASSPRARSSPSGAAISRNVCRSKSETKNASERGSCACGCMFKGLYEYYPSSNWE